MARLKFFTPSHKEEETKNGYHLKCYESDPYYYVVVYKNGAKVDSHVLTDDDGEFDKLVKAYEGGLHYDKIRL